MNIRILKKVRNFIFIILGFSLMTSCGFHLRGVMTMPPWLQLVAIVTENVHKDLALEVKKQLKAYSIQIDSNPNRANYLLILEQDSSQQQITNISASTTPRQYQLIYDLQFKLVNAKGEELIPSSHVITTRLLTVNNDRILGSNSEEILLFGEMRREAAMQLVNRLSHACQQPAATPKY